MKAINFIKKLAASFWSLSSGQILMEVLIAIIIGSILLIAATTTIVEVIRGNFENRSYQEASLLAVDLANKVESFSASNWPALNNLTTGSSSKYTVISGPSSSTIFLGEESISFNNISSGLVAHLKLDEATGSDIYDYVANISNGTFVNSAIRATSTNCAFGSCLYLPGNPYYPYAYLSNTSTLNFGTSSFSASLWGKFEDLTYPNGWFAIKKSNVCYNVGNPGWDIGTGYYADGLNVCYSDGTNVVYQSVDFDSGYKAADLLGVWSNLVVVFDKSESRMKFYVNGVKQSNELDISAVTGSVDNAEGIYIGYAYGWQTNGYLDDIRLYNRTLNDEEIKNIYQSDSYSRYFYVESVERDNDNNIVSSGGNNDPSTKKISAGISWKDGRLISYPIYITRRGVSQFLQTDWSGGSGNDGPFSSTFSYFSTSSNVSASSSLVLFDPLASGDLTSSIFDLGISGAVDYIIFHGTKPPGTNVSFQLAYSDSPSGPWTYLGPGELPSTYFTPTAGNVSLKVDIVNNMRYVRYKVFLTPSGGVSPSVDDLVIGWAR